MVGDRVTRNDGSRDRERERERESNDTPMQGKEEAAAGLLKTKAKFISIIVSVLKFYDDYCLLVLFFYDDSCVFLDQDFERERMSVCTA